MAFSVVARVLHEKTGGLNETDFAKPYFTEWIMRTPSLVAGLAAIALIGYLALRLHSLLAAWLAMGWATLHPWMLEFSTSVRGYAFAMTFLALAVVAAVQIFRAGGGWRWRVVFGLGEMLAFCSVPTLLHGLVALNVAVFAGIIFDRSVDPAAQRGHLGAFFSSNIVAAIGAYLTFKPLLEQLRTYLGGEQFHVDMSWTWIGDCVSNLLTGQPYVGWERGHPWAAATEQWPLALLGAGALLASAFAIAALWRGWRGGLFAILITLAFLAPPLTTFAQGKITHFYLFPWYMAWQLPLWLTLFAIGAAELLTKGTKRLPPWTAPAAAASLLLILGIATQHPRNAYLNTSVEAQQESAASYRKSPNPYAPGHKEIITTSLITANHAYDPWNHRMRSIDDLWIQVARAEESGKPLYCDTAWIERIPLGIPRICAPVARRPLLRTGGEVLRPATPK